MSVIAVEADKESFKDSLPGNAGRFSVSKLFGTVLASRSGELVDTTGSLSSAGVIGIYFSAHWCPPCRIFTPKLCDSSHGQLPEKCTRWPQRDVKARF